MIESATGVIMRTYTLTDTSLIVHWLTPNFGRIATAAKGARRPKSPFMGKLDLFYLCDFNFYRARLSELHTLKEVTLRDPHTALRSDIARLQQACYAAALIEQTTETDTPLPGIYGLFVSLLVHLVSNPARQHTVFAFELKLLNELGLKPNPAKMGLTAGAKQIAKAMISAAWPDLARLRLSEAQTTELRQFLHGFLIYHLGRLPPGRAEALKAGAQP